MAVDTTTAGELTREQVSTVLTRPLEQASIFLQAGPTIFDTDGNPVRVPKLPVSTADALSWVGESELIPEQSPDFSEATLLPSTMKSVKVITRYSNELARQSVVALDNALRDRLVSDVAAKIDGQLLSASGDGITTPRGLFAYPGVQTLPVTGELTLDALLDAQGMALAENVDPARLVVFVRPEDYMSLRGAKDAQQRYMLTPDAQQGGTIVPALGMRVFVSSRIPDQHAAVVDMSQVAVARDLAPSVKVLTERYADYDQQAIRVTARYDAAPLNPEAVVTLTGVGTVG
jgi:HK97 family phage major capsid protein